MQGGGWVGEGHTQTRRVAGKKNSKIPGGIKHDLVVGNGYPMRLSVGFEQRTRTLPITVRIRVTVQ